MQNDLRPDKDHTVTESADRGKILRYTLALFVTGFIYREVVYVSNTPYPGWLFIVLLVGIVLLVLPYESFTDRTL